MVLNLSYAGMVGSVTEKWSLSHRVSFITLHHSLSLILFIAVWLILPIIEDHRLISTSMMFNVRSELAHWRKLSRPCLTDFAFRKDSVRISCIQAKEKKKSFTAEGISDAYAIHHETLGRIRKNSSFRLWIYQSLNIRRLPISHTSILTVSLLSNELHWVTRSFSFSKASRNDWTCFSHRYHLRATINHEHDHFTATILDSSNRIFLYNDLEGLEQIDQSPFYAETAIYVLKK